MVVRWLSFLCWLLDSTAKSASGRPGDHQPRAASAHQIELCVAVRACVISFGMRNCLSYMTLCDTGHVNVLYAHHFVSTRSNHGKEASLGTCRPISIFLPADMAAHTQLHSGASPHYVATLYTASASAKMPPSLPACLPRVFTTLRPSVAATRPGSN